MITFAASYISSRAECSKEDSVERRLLLVANTTAINERHHRDIFLKRIGWEPDVTPINGSRVQLYDSLEKLQFGTELTTFKYNPTFQAIVSVFFFVGSLILVDPFASSTARIKPPPPTVYISGRIEKRSRKRERERESYRVHIYIQW